MMSTISNGVTTVPKTNHRFNQINGRSIREWLMNMTSDPMRQEKISWALLHITASYIALRITPPDGFFDSEMMLEYLCVVARYEPEPRLVEDIPETFFYYLLHYVLGRYGILRSAETFSFTIAPILTDVSNQGDDKFQLAVVPAVGTIPHPELHGEPQNSTNTVMTVQPERDRERLTTNYRKNFVNGRKMSNWLTDISVEPYEQEELSWVLNHVVASYVTLRIVPPMDFMTSPRFDEYVRLLRRYEPEPNLTDMVPRSFIYFHFHYVLGTYGILHPCETFSAALQPILPTTQTRTWFGYHLTTPSVPETMPRPEVHE